MPNIRSLPALGLALLLTGQYLLAQAPATPPASKAAEPAAKAEAKPIEPPTEAELALDEAVKKVRDLRSVSAEVAQSADMLGQRFAIKGRYLKAPDNRFRLELRVSGNGVGAGQMVQVSDGKTLWDYQQVLDASRCQTMKLDQVLKKLEAPEFNAEFREQVMGSLGLAGPDALLAGLRKAIKFDRKESASLDVQLGKDQVEARDVWVLRGEWQDREALVDPRKGATLPATGPLPPYVPSLAVVWIGKQDGWPYKLQLEGRARSILTHPRQPTSENRTPAARGDGGPTQDRPSRLVLVYGNVQLNPQLGGADFAFQPPEPEKVVDTTKDILDGLDQKLNLEATKAEAAEKGETGGKDDPITPLSVPKLQSDAAKAPR